MSAQAKEIKIKTPYDYKKWYQENREKHLAYVCEKIECECGRSVCRSHLPKHRNSKLHVKSLNELINKQKPSKDTLIELNNKIDTLQQMITKFQLSTANQTH